MRVFENRMNAVLELRELEGEIGVGGGGGGGRGPSQPLDFYFCVDSSLASAKLKGPVACLALHRGDARDTTRQRAKL